MKRKTAQDPFADPSFTTPSSEDLRGRQSVRATFKLTHEAIGALSVLAVHLGIKQKSLFDHLIQDLTSLRQIARQVEADAFGGLQRVQKTYVLSRHTLNSLEQAAQRFETPRDALVEYSIQRLLPLIAEEKKRHRARKRLLGDISDYLAAGNTLLEHARKQLGEDDPVFIRLAALMASGDTALRFMIDYVQRGEVIEDF